MATSKEIGSMALLILTSIFFIFKADARTPEYKQILINIYTSAKAFHMKNGIYCSDFDLIGYRSYHDLNNTNYEILSSPNKNCEKLKEKYNERCKKSEIQCQNKTENKVDLLKNYPIEPFTNNNSFLFLAAAVNPRNCLSLWSINEKKEIQNHISSEHNCVNIYNNDLAYKDKFSFLERLFYKSLKIKKSAYKRSDKGTTAIKEISKSCINNNAKNCHELALHYSLAGEILDSKKYYKKSCHLKYADSCNELSTLLLKENRVNRSIEYDIKSCSLGNKKGCRNAAEKNYKLGKFKTSRKFYKKIGNKGKMAFLSLLMHDLSFSKKYYKKQCNEKITSGCFFLGYIEKMNNNFNKANKWYRLGCSDFNFICAYLAFNELIVGNKEIGRNLSKKLCDNSKANTHSCRLSKYFKYYEEKPNMANYWSKNCNESKPDNCYYSGLNEIIEFKNFKSAKKLFRKSCDFGYGNACVELANLSNRYWDFKNFATLMNEACEKKSESACNFINKNYFPFNLDINLALKSQDSRH